MLDFLSARSLQRLAFSKGGPPRFAEGRLLMADT
jgi:hypothetical protein